MYDPIAKAEAIVPKLRETSADSESQRRLTDDAVALLREAGLARLMTPARYGGHQLPPRAQVLTNAITAHGCSAASWVQMVCAAHTFILGRFSRRCQDEIFGENPDSLIPGTPSSQGNCMRTGGGWLVNGRWQFCSGVDLGKWILVGAGGVTDESGNRTPDTLVVIPAQDLIIDDTWHVLGMRGTGSKDIVAKDVFVPEYRGVNMANAFLGTVPDIDIPLYRLPVAATLAAMGLGTIVGIAERGLADFIDQTRLRRDIYVGGAKAMRAGLQMRVAEANTEIELAGVLAERNCTLLDAAMADPTPMGTEARAQIRWNAAYGTQLCRRATERLYAAAGAHATYNVNALQGFFRDINTASHHAVLDFDTVAEIKGKVLLDVEQNYAMI